MSVFSPAMPIDARAVSVPAAARGQEPQLVIDAVSKRFGDGPGAVVAVDGMSFAVMPGEFVTVIGPSGCGKSTLFSIIGGLQGSYEGDVRVEGERISGPHPAVGMVFQEESTFPWRTVADNVAFPLELRGVARAGRARTLH